MNALYLVCGGREYADAEHVREVLLHHIPDPRQVWVLHGNAPGADTLAHLECLRRGIPVLSMPALWDVEGRSAGPKRNERMRELLWLIHRTDTGSSDLEVAVIAFPGGRGTEHMCALAKESGIRVFKEKR